MTLWHWRDVCAAVGAPIDDGPEISGISIDSRTLIEGDLFIALPGDPGPRFNTHHRSARDGHDYVDSAAARGAVGALVSRQTAARVPQIVTQDTLDGLWSLGRAARARLACPVIAVTGSSGKTTVKTLLSAALACPASAASFNNFIGVPLSLARTPAKSRAAVFEIGTNHPGEIAPLAELVQPHVALVLNVMPAHIENFPSMDALCQEKLAILHGLVPGGTLVLLDNLKEAMPADARTDIALVTYGESSSAHVRLTRFDAGARCASIDWNLPERIAQSGSVSARSGSVDAYVPGGGRHRALSMTATIACLLAAGFEPQHAREIGDDVVPAGRGRIHEIGGIAVVDDSYNANPASMEFALGELATMAAARGGRAFAILGEMLELGPESATYHGALADSCRLLDGVLCVGEGMRALYAALAPQQRFGYVHAASDVDLPALADTWQPGDCVLVKGSNRVFWAHDFVPRLVSALVERRRD
jgi:UDP-N-acetylmuramoyl-tripeptide--D-alanyl-D-alanine ligase